MALHPPLSEADQRINQVLNSKDTELYLSYLALEEFPMKITEISHLETLVLTGNRIRSIPEEIQKLTKLRTLDLTGNQLTQLPEEICHLPELRQLELASNSLKSLPKALGNLGNLQSLDLFGNCISRLPESITFCHNLSTLRASENDIATLPEHIGDLTRLEILDLSYNEIEHLPLSLFNLTQLRELYFTANQLDVPFDILSRFSTQPEEQLKRIREYQKALSKKLEKDKALEKKTQVKELTEIQLAELIVLKMSHFKERLNGIPFKLKWPDDNNLHKLSSRLILFDQRITDIYCLCFCVEETLRSSKMERLTRLLEKKVHLSNYQRDNFIQDLRAIARDNELECQIKVKSIKHEQVTLLEGEFIQPQEYSRYFVLWLVLSELIIEGEIDLTNQRLPILEATLAHVISSYLHEPNIANGLANGMLRLLLDDAKP